MTSESTQESKLYEELRVIILMGINDVRDDAMKKIKRALDTAYHEGYLSAVETEHRCGS